MRLADPIERAVPLNRRAGGARAEAVRGARHTSE